ncbi:gamma-glutamylcyclotransferase family protein [Jannaschia pohangensis]|uniref:ChaC-like protein n=1 Tax=Jannaschia pohangensis TaxID=390807 RepID=A0A1I3MJ05_9RHOB|nr:gamma-glutamylcyclotransferase family protein [Jannaschia pohangensis]SFI96656.1 hypothetical protein SAMN04488095_1858 [Jannaschia pohangensis]
MTPRFFGYGSLVNLTTHDYPNPQRLRVAGWRRAWRHTPLQPAAFLTAVPDPGSVIDGIMADVPADDWAALDQRESGYIRSPVAEGAQIYHIPHDLHGPATQACTILLSYLDVVVQGYLREFGTDGVAAFFETTDGWDTPIHDDRTAPLYPRARTLSPEELALVDRQLARVRS